MPPTPPQEPNGFLLFGLCLIAAAALIGVLKLNHWWHTRPRTSGGVKSSEGARHGTAVMSSAERPLIAVRSPSPREGTAPLPTPVPTTNLTEDRVFRDMVLLKDKQGKWFFSGKKIYTAWGGNHDELLMKVRELRGDGAPEDAPDDLTPTPYAGRMTRASYYPNEPELEYHPPR
jgi:hypothetical protein